MKILMVNKFLYPKGGAETYVLSLGEILEKQGHEVQYFGLKDEKNVVGNEVNAYISSMDFHGSNRWTQIKLAFKTIYSLEAKRKIYQVLEDFKPDICHINNFNYQLTPSIIVSISRWMKKTGKRCKIIYTAHDLQLICPNHQCRNPLTNENCEKCLSGSFVNCMKDNCVHGSKGKSIIGMMEAVFWKRYRIYKRIDKIICCSDFLKTKMDSNPLFATKTITLHNFISSIKEEKVEKKEYVIYFGRFSKEKGIATLVEVCKELPEIKFVFAGSGPLEERLEGISNIQNCGFQIGTALERLVKEARFMVYPSEWYENCPFAVMEAQICETPVLGARIGGIPELVKDGVTGEFFESGNKDELKSAIKRLWLDRKLTEEYIKNCKDVRFDTGDEYYQKLVNIYQSK